MRNILIDKREEGVVLITSMLFLMIITLLGVSSLQSPKTDIMISGNQKFINQAQELANIGIMAGRNWLEVHRQGNAIYNVKNGGVVNLLASDTGIPGFRDTSPSNNFNSISSVGRFRWKMIRITDLNDADSGLGITEGDFSNYMQNIRAVNPNAAHTNIIDKFRTKGKGKAGTVESDIEHNGGIFQHYYIFSEGQVGPNNSIAASSEAVIKYKDIVENIGYK